VVAVGGLAVGGVAVGGLAIGPVAAGAAAVGWYACGAVALGRYVVSIWEQSPEGVQFFKPWVPWL
jgi:hypothetical protein